MKNIDIKKPIIVVTGPDKLLPIGGWCARIGLWLSGAKSVYITPSHSQLPKTYHGVILSGGDDIEPKHYGQTGDAGSEYNPQRDALEMNVARIAINRHIPIMGICRGAQMLNVIMGGTLHADIRPLRRKTPNRNSIFPIKQISIIGQSRLSSILGNTKMSVNSLHNQAIKRVSDTLTPVARDEDGFIQSVESTGGEYIVGFQWHPEYLLYRHSERKIFRHFVKACRSK